jgi:hypothetical protein
VLKALSPSNHPRDDLEGDRVERVLGRLRDAVLRHPAATQAAFSALVAEGRRFARTEDGAALADALAGSELLARGRMIWEVLTMSAFVEGEDGLPSVIIDELARAASNGSLESVLSRVFERGR